MKPQPIYLPNKNYFAWTYEEQTQIKHRVLEAYSKVYMSKLGANTDTLFVDCHGGCGAYIDDKKNLNYGKRRWNVLRMIQFPDRKSGTKILK